VSLACCFNLVSSSSFSASFVSSSLILSADARTLCARFLVDSICVAPFVKKPAIVAFVFKTNPLAGPIKYKRRMAKKLSRQLLPDQAQKNFAFAQTLAAVPLCFICDQLCIAERSSTRL
jgi:hypothetical protein